MSALESNKIWDSKNREMEASIVCRDSKELGLGFGAGGEEEFCSE